MLSAREALKPRDGEVCLQPSQLRPGVHVRLPLAWLDHQFLFNTFVIETDDQVRQIAALDIPHVLCDESRCRVMPLPVPVVLPAMSEAEERRLAEVKAQQVAVKTVRIARMNEIRGHLDRSYRHYVGASKSVKGAIGRFGADAKEAINEMVRVSADSTKLILHDVDSAIVLIAEKGHSDGFAAHALSVMTLSLLLGKQARLPEEALNTLGVAALLHDVGKLTLNPGILQTAERTKHEEALYRSHCELGHAAILKSGGASTSLLQTVLHHHEHYDGTGFPGRLVGDQIHIAARVVAIADRFDTLANPAAPKLALSPSEALSRMWTREKAWFDPVLLQIFIRAMGVYPPGSVVLLNDSRIGAVVVSADIASPLCPQVLIYDPEIPRAEAIIIDLAREPSVQIQRAVRLQERAEEELDYLLPRRRMRWFPNEMH